MHGCGVGQVDNRAPVAFIYPRNIELSYFLLLLMILLILFQVRDPMPAVFFFLIDVSMNAIQTGATAAACSAVSQVIADLPVSSCLDFSCYNILFVDLPSGQ